MNRPISILVGAQWGDEGKGKWIDILGREVSYAARYQGGNNAGHTLYIRGTKVVLHQIPSAIFHEGRICALLAGVVINPQELQKEIKHVGNMTKVGPENLWLSPRAHIISPAHIARDQAQESQSTRPIGTTKRGIGPTYTDKAKRSGLRLGHYIDRHKREEWVRQQISTCPELEIHTQAWEEFHAAAEFLRPFVRDAELGLRKAAHNGDPILLEGAQGALLDIDHGTYPYVTSSSTAAGGAIASLGINPKLVDAVYGVAKAYTTRVGEGPMPTELSESESEWLRTKGGEFGATTGRPRRCGWLDAVALKYAAELNGFDGLIINKLDILSGLGELKICTHYHHPTLGTIDHFPWDPDLLYECTPGYVTLEGWEEDLKLLPDQRFESLPRAAQDFINKISVVTQTPVYWVGTGVGRQDYVSYRPLPTAKRS